MDEQQHRRTYLTGLFDQLETAVARGNRDAAYTIADRVEADGHPTVAQILRRGLADTTLGRAGDAGEGGTDA